MIIKPFTRKELKIIANALKKLTSEEADLVCWALTKKARKERLRGKQ